jgi:2-polyprenyl-3-methyl-5-hydroxy-6-metoxy-1,4-benzoquinol methylase
MIEYASSKNLKTKNLHFDCKNFLNIRDQFHLVTAIGVLQKCGISLDLSICKMASLLKPHGQLFITTKNLDWSEFKRDHIHPEQGHKWFTRKELEDAFKLAQLKIIECDGFLPRQDGGRCKYDESHSIFILAKKEGVDYGC